MTNDLITRLATLAATGASGIATRGALSQAHAVLAGAGTLPGLRVLDTVTGQVVEVVGAAVVYLPAADLEEAKYVE